MATITIADYLAAILEEGGGGRQQRPRREPTSADWAEGIDPTTLNRRPFGAGDPVDFGAIGAAAEQLEYGMAYGDLPRQLEQAALYSDPTALAGLTIRGTEGEPGLYDIARQLDIPGRSTMRKAELVSAIAGSAPSAADLGGRLARHSSADIALMQARLTPRAADYAAGLLGGRQELYARSQALFGFGPSNVDIALQRAGLGWEQVAGMSEQELAGVLHGPIAGEFMARGGARTIMPPETGDEPIYYAPRARADIDARPEGAAESYAGRLAAGAQRASLAQAWMLQRGRTPGAKTVLGPQEFYRGTGLVGQVQHVLQEPGIAALFDPEGAIESLVVGDPGKGSKRVSQLAQEHAISMTGLPTVESRMLGQLARVPETVQPARAWVSMGEWLAQGAGLYGTHLGRPYAELTRRLRLPKGQEITVRPGQRFAGGERIPVFGTHEGLEFGKSYEEIIVQRATPIEKFTEEGEPYTEVQFQALGMLPTGSLVAGKHWFKGGMTGSTLPAQMGVDVVIPPNELYQLGALVGSVAPPELQREIWGKGAGRWGPESGRQFAEWLQGPGSPLEERLLPAQTFDLADPITQKMLGLGKLVHPKTGEVLTAETARTAMVPGTGAAISAQLKDIGFEADVGLRLTQAFAGKTQMIKPEAAMALAEQHPRLFHEIFRGGVRHQAEMAQILGASAANVAPESALGQEFIRQAVPISELGERYPEFLQQARDVMTQAGVEEPETQPDVLQGITMNLLGEAYPGRGIAIESETGARYLPNMALMARKFGYPFEEDVLNQLPRLAAGLVEHEAARGATGRQYIPPDMIPEGKTPADYTPEELAAMEQQYRERRIGRAMEEFTTATSSKESLMNLIGVRAGKYMVSPHPTAEMGVIPSRYVTGERVLRKMVVAPGASEEEREQLVQQIMAGEVEGPRMGLVGYPILEAGQARPSLGYTTPGEAITRGIAPSREEFEEMYAGRVGVSPVAAYGQEKDWDIDEFLRMVQTKYVRTKEGGWRPQHMARQISVKELNRLATGGAISGELARHLEKMEERSTMGGVREWIGRQAGAEPVPIQEFQTSSEDKATGGITKGMAFNVFSRRIAGRMRGEPELEAARRAAVTPFQTALDIKPIEGGWENVMERMYSFDLATKGWSAGWARGGREGSKGRFVRTMGEWADVTIQDILGLKGMKGEPLAPEHLASMLLRPSADRERWEQLTGAIGRWQGATVGQRGGMVRGIRELALGEADLETEAGLQQVYEQSPLLGAGLEAAAFRAIEKGTAGVEEPGWRQTGRGAWIAEQFGPYKAWLAERGREVKGYIQAMSPQTHLERLPTLYERFRAVEAYATGHPAAHPALKASVERAARLARLQVGRPEAAEPDEYLGIEKMRAMYRQTAAAAVSRTAQPGFVEFTMQGDTAVRYSYGQQFVMRQEYAGGYATGQALIARRGAEPAAAEAEVAQAEVEPTAPPPPPPPAPLQEEQARFQQMQAEFEALPAEEQSRQRAAAAGFDPNGGYAFGPHDPARGAQPATRRPLTAAERAPHEDVTEGLTWEDPLAIARRLRAGMRRRAAPPAAAGGRGGAAPPGGPPAPSAAPPPEEPTGPTGPLRPEQPPVNLPENLAQQYPYGARIITRPSGGGWWTGIFPADEPQRDPTREEYRMRAAMVQRAMGVQVDSPQQRAQQIAALHQAGVRGAALTGLTNIQAGRAVSGPQAAAIMSATGYDPGVQGRLAEALGGVGAGGRGAGSTGATGALDKFTRTVEEARGHLEKYGDTMKEQLDLFSQGRLRIGDRAAWGRDVRAMVRMGQQVVGQAEALGQPVPEQFAGDVAGWQGILGAAGGAGMGGGIGAGFGGAQRGGPLDRFAPSGRGMFSGNLGQLAWGLFNIQRLWRYTGGQVTGAMGQYVGYQAQQQQAMAALGIGEGYGGAVTDMMAGQAAMQRARLGFGRAAWETWGFIPRALGQVDATMQPGLLQRGAALGLPLAAAPIMARLGGSIAGRMGMTGLAGGLGFLGTAGAYGSLGMGLAAAGVYGTNQLLQATGAAGQIAGAQAEIAATGRFYPGVPGMQSFLPGAETRQGEPAPEVQAFQRASMELQQQFGLTPQAADQAIAAYGQSTGRTPEMGDWSAADIQAAGGLSRFAPSLQQQIAGGAQQLGMAAGIPMGGAGMAGMVEQLRQVGPARRAELGQIAGMLQPLQQQFLQTTGQRMPADVWGMTIPQARRAQLLGQGSQAAWSRLGLEQGLPEWVTMQPDTGMAVGSTWGGGILAQGMQAGRFTMGGLAEGAFQRELEAGNIVINAEEATVAIGGQRVPFTQVGLQDVGRRLQRDYQQWQREQQATGLAARYAYTTGQEMEGAPAGAPTFGRGQWAIQDAMTALQRQYQTTQFGFQREQLDMTNRQFYERWQQQAQRAGVQYRWGLQDIGTQWARTQRRFQWAEEDLAYRGAQSTMQYGWQMEDIEERMRYATGRERRQLMRQRERATIQYGMGMGRLETEEGRLDERRKWAEEDHRRTRKRYEQRYQWSRRDMQLQRRHHDERMNLARRRQSASERYFDETNQLQDEQREAAREYWQWQHEQQKTSLERAKTLAEQLNTVQDLMEALGQAQQQQTSWFAAQFQEDGSITKAWHGLVGDMLSGIDQLTSAAKDYRRYLSSNPYYTGRRGRY